MPSFYSTLGKSKDPGEEVEGAFSCQEEGCSNVAVEAVYFEESRVLKWSCKDGHKSEIEGIKL